MTPAGLVALAEALLGVGLIGAVLWDVFQTVVLPRPSPTRWRIAKNLTRYAYRLWRWRAYRAPSADRRERVLGTFAPSVVLILLAVWVVVLVVGFGLLFLAAGRQFEPPLADIGSALYAAGVAMLTIGFGDIVPTGAMTRVLVLVAAATGLGVVALVITYLFSLYGSFQRREVLVVTLDARAGAPPSGVALLETFARTGMADELPGLFADWEEWSAEVLDSHVAYPILVYFRSSHDNESWVSSLGAVLDATVLVLTTIEGLPRGRAEMLLGIGIHLVEDVGNFFGFPLIDDPGVERSEYDEARERLARAGYRVRPADVGWVRFAEHRKRYAGRLNLIAEYLITPPTQWVGDRAPAGYHPS